jgi:hypothetical protein
MVVTSEQHGVKLLMRRVGGDQPEVEEEIVIVGE